jgi:hypothetical protein|eukprot:COSAG06_NODE_1_length_58652_cov_31.600967_15_plen_145_part_00
MTGRYVPMHGFEESSDGGGSGVNGTGPSPAVPLRFRFLPQTLQLANYSTLMAGKWHLGYPTPAYVPEARGFHEYLGYLSGAEDYYTHVKTPVRVSACRCVLASLGAYRYVKTRVHTGGRMWRDRGPVAGQVALERQRGALGARF